MKKERRVQIEEMDYLDNLIGNWGYKPVNPVRQLPHVVYAPVQHSFHYPAIMEYKEVALMNRAETLSELKMLRTRVEVLDHHQKALLDAGLDNYDDATVIKFNKSYTLNGITKYREFAAIKKDGAWFVTGRTGPNNISWEQLVLWAGPENIASRSVAVKWDTL